LLGVDMDLAGENRRGNDVTPTCGAQRRFAPSSSASS
jgi:hypothetical protein